MKEIDDLFNFSNLTYRLMYLLRWNIYPRSLQETCASHIAQVSLLSLYLVEQLKNKIKLDELKIYKMSITHDLAEAPTAIDVVHKIKMDYPDIKAMIEKIELVEMEKLMGKEYKDLLNEFNECKTIESVIVQICDILSCKVYCINELNMGNLSFKLPLIESESRLNKLISILNGFLENEKL